MNKSTPYAKLPLLTGSYVFLGITLAALVAIVVLSLIGVVSAVYLILGLIAGVDLALTAIVIFANLYARRSGKYMVLASYFRGYSYLSNAKVKQYGLVIAGTKAQLLFGLVEFTSQVVFNGLVLTAVILWTKIL